MQMTVVGLGFGEFAILGCILILFFALVNGRGRRVALGILGVLGGICLLTLLLGFFFLGAARTTSWNVPSQVQVWDGEQKFWDGEKWIDSDSVLPPQFPENPANTTPRSAAPMKLLFDEDGLHLSKQPEEEFLGETSPRVQQESPTLVTNGSANVAQGSDESLPAEEASVGTVTAPAANNEQPPPAAAPAESPPAESPTDSVADPATAEAPAAAAAPTDTANSTSTETIVEATDGPRPATPPDWINGPAFTMNGSYHSNCKVGPFSTRAECEVELMQAFEEEARVYVASHLGQQCLPSLYANLPYLQSQVVKERFEERIEGTYGPMLNLHARLEFDRTFDNFLLNRHRQVQISQRLALTASGGGLLLAFLSTIFGYLKIDTMTRGYYSRRLRWGTAAVIFSILSAATFLIRSSVGF